MKHFLYIAALALSFIVLSSAVDAQTVLKFNAGGRDKEQQEDDESIDEPTDNDEVKGLSFGLNLGSYFGSSGSANIYNGSGPFEGYINEASQVRWFSVEERLGSTSYFINDIQAINTYYGSSSYTFPYDSYPLNMKYNPSIMVGLQIKYHFNRFAAMVFNLNAMKLKAAGQFTMQFQGTPVQLNQQRDVRLMSIAGEEQRFNINLGYRQGWMMGDASNFYLQMGGSLLGTKWTNNYVLVAERQYDLVTNTPVFGGTAVTVQPKAGIGVGAFFGTGVEFFVGNKSFDLSFNLYRDKVVIQTFEKFLWNKSVQFTFSL